MVIDLADADRMTGERDRYCTGSHFVIRVTPQLGQFQRFPLRLLQARRSDEMRLIRRSLVAMFLAQCAVLPCAASTLAMDFEAIADGTPLTNQYVGASFSNATIITSGISLNELDFPPRSGQNVAFDDGGALTMAFAKSISTFQGFFTYSSALTLSAYDKSHSLLSTVFSTFTNNTATAGDIGSAPNERLQLAAQGIAYISVIGDAGGGSFVVDDVLVTVADGPPVTAPEPGMAALVGVALLARAARRLAQRRERI